MTVGCARRVAYRGDLMVVRVLDLLLRTQNRALITPPWTRCNQQRDNVTLAERDGIKQATRDQKVTKRARDRPNDWDWRALDKLASSSFQILAPFNGFLGIKESRNIWADVAFIALRAVEDFAPLACGQAFK